MSEQPSHDDLICAFLDEELSEGEIDALLAQLECQDARARACRQSLITSALVQRRAVVGDVSSRVREAIAQDCLGAAGATAVPLTERRGRRMDWKVPAGGLALAASMAIVAILVVRPSGSGAELAVAEHVPAEEPATAAQMVSAGTNAPDAAPTRELVIAAPETSRPVVAQWGSAEPGARSASTPAALREQLDAYLLSHARTGGGSALSGSLGYARVTASPQQQSEESPR